MPYIPAPIDSGITVSGSSVRSIVEAVKSFSVLVGVLLEVMKVQTKDASGALVVDPNGWYPLEDYLLAYKKIDSLLGGRGLEKVGAMVPRNAFFPPNITDIRQALQSMDIAFHMNHRRQGQPMFDPETGTMLEGIGHYLYQPVEGRQELILVSETPYPCRFDLGLILGMAQRFEPAATIAHDLAQGCRQKGGTSCTYAVSWP
ncbi:hypothetical protein [Stigmatella aurantiaca]|uniref:Conserved uncharacterized protein n=1 Tax=Stigmatella aurantiaca (strain DW4/3-1) TaxID=378806 RepID=Q094U5_STIAD|nr:hypothetical protein [Stigmatella aurantiaca]ADO73226.1 conserved uncharacterized protein [Stigmatella aurantiaca DW4/3-1]EAU67262.1 hypothetical protein STIAU_7533 [Stigmatella aurantiaca DW4/3-1]